MMKAWYLVLGLASLPSVAAARDADKTLPRADVFQKVIDCRAIADNTQRLACFDAQVARLDEAATRKDVVVVDQAEVRRTRKGLFGFNIGDLGIFGGKDPGPGGDEEGFTQITSTIQSARQDASGKWILVIEGGAKWVQIDTTSIRTPKPGQAIKIRKASLGSYFANINDQHAIRMIRQN